jgi:hypothetical protein
MGLFGNFKQQICRSIFWNMFCVTRQNFRLIGNAITRSPLSLTDGVATLPPPTPDRRDGGASRGVGREIIRGGRGGGQVGGATGLSPAQEVRHYPSSLRNMWTTPDITAYFSIIHSSPDLCVQNQRCGQCCGSGIRCLFDPLIWIRDG